MDASNKTHGARWLAFVLHAFEFLVIVGLIILAVTLLVTLPLWWKRDPVLGLTVPVQVLFDAGAVSVTALGGAIESARLIQVKGSLELFMASPWLHWGFMAILGGLLLLTAVLFRQLRRIVESVLGGSPFCLENAVRLGRISWIIVGTSVLNGVGTLIPSWWAIRSFEVSGAELAPAFAEEGTVFLLGWLILILSEVFKRGALMEEERRLTV